MLNFSPSYFQENISAFVLILDEIFRARVKINNAYSSNLFERRPMDLLAQKFQKIVKIYLKMNAFIEILLLDLVKTKRKKIEMVLKSRRLAIHFIF